VGQVSLISIFHHESVVVYIVSDSVTSLHDGATPNCEAIKDRNSERCSSSTGQRRHMKTSVPAVRLPFYL